MSDDKGKGCMGCGCLAIGVVIYVIMSSIGIIIFFSSNDAIETVKDVPLKRLFWMLTDNISHSTTEYNGLISIAEKAGIDLNEGLYDSLVVNPNISNIKFDENSIADNMVIVSVSMDMKKNKTKKIKIEMSFYVRPKSFLHMKFSKIETINEIIITDGNNPPTYLDRKNMILWLSLIYSKRSIDSL